MVTLTVEDDGVGLPEPGPTGSGLGVRIMAHRAAMIGGSFALEPAPTGGTMVTCSSLNLLQKARRLMTSISPDIASQKRTVFLVDNHPLVREWLTNLIQQPTTWWCAARRGRTPRPKGNHTTKPNVVIVDISLKDSSGIELIKTIKSANRNRGDRLVHARRKTHYAERALRAGAGGYIMKRETTKKIIRAIREVLDGKLHVSDDVTDHRHPCRAAKDLAADRRSATQQPGARSLRTPRRWQETRHVAETLQLSIKTVQAYCARIKEKLTLANGTELLREAICWRESTNKG